jgi:ankyrin repeat protein
MQKDFNRFIEVVHFGVDLNKPGKDGRLPLVLAAEQDNHFVHVALLTGAKINAQEPRTGQSALHAAVRSCNTEVCTFNYLSCV